MLHRFNNWPQHVINTCSIIHDDRQCTNYNTNRSCFTLALKVYPVRRDYLFQVCLRASIHCKVRAYIILLVKIQKKENGNNSLAPIESISVNVILGPWLLLKLIKRCSRSI